MFLRIFLLTTLYIVSIPSARPDLCWSAEFQTRSNPVQLRDIVDAQLIGDEVVYLHRDKGPQKRTRGLDFYSITEHRDKAKIRFKRAFADPDDVSAFYAVAIRGANEDLGIVIYRYQIGNEKPAVVSVSDRLTPAQIMQADDGRIFLWNRVGNMFVFIPESKKIEKIDLFEKVIRSESRPRLREIKPIQSPNGRIAFYSEPIDSIDRPQLRKVLLFGKGAEFEAIEATVKGRGPAVFGSENELLFFQSDSIAKLNLETKKLSISKSDSPFENTKPVQIFELANGSIIGKWRKFYNSKLQYDVQAFEGGGFFQLAEFDRSESQWTKLDIPLDREIRGDSHIAFNGLESWITTAEGGLLRVDKQKRFGRLDYKSGVNILGAKPRIVVLPQRNSLFVFSEKMGVEHNLSKLQAASLKSEKRDSRWSRYYARDSFVDAEGFLHMIDIATNSIIAQNYDSMEKIPLPSPSEMQISGPLDFLGDSQGGYWIFLKGERDESAYFSSRTKKWHLFKATETNFSNKKRNGKPFPITSKELALQHFVRNEAESNFENFPIEDFYIGNSDNKSVQFNSSGHVIFVNKFNRVCYFNGKRWNSPRAIRGREVKKAFRISAPYFENDLVRVNSGESSYEMTVDAWKRSEKDIEAFRDWKPARQSVDRRIQNSKVAKSNYKERRKVELAGIEKCPINFDHKQVTSDLFFYATNQQQVAVRHPSGAFVTFDSRNTPIENTPIQNLTVDKRGRCCFHIGMPYIKKIVVYEPPVGDFEFKSTELGVLKSESDVLILEGDQIQKLKNPLMRVRIGNGLFSDWTGWSNKFRLPPTSKGSHKLLVEMGSADFPLQTFQFKFNFSVEYDFDKVCNKLLDQISAEEYALRERAFHQIYAIGSPALSFIETRIASEEPELDIDLEYRLNELKGNIEKIKSWKLQTTVEKK